MSQVARRGDYIYADVGGLGETWVPLHTNSPFTGAFTFEDAAPGATNRFYRGRLP